MYENANFSTVGSTSVLYWRSNLNLRIASYSWNNYENALCPNESALVRVFDDEECQPALWNAGQDIQVSIVEGAEYTSFYYGGNQLIGDNVTFSTDVHGNYFTAYGGIELNYDVEYNDTTADKLVVLEAVVNGLTARDTILIPKSAGYVLNGEIEEGKERIVKWERLRINSWLETSGMCGDITEPPEGTTFDAEITQGAEFGGLIDTTTGETTALLTGLLADGDQISIEYFADGDSAQTDEEVIVRISNSIPGVEPLYISFFTGRSEIFVTIDPEEILAGEMSDVFVYWYDEMDSLVLMPGDVPLQVEIIEVAEFGDIYDPVSNLYSDFFDEIYQGFKFQAADEIDTSSARVLIRVSTLFGGGITAPIGQGGKNKIENKVNINKEADGKDEEKGDPDLLIGEEIYGIGKAVVNPKEEIEILLGETKYFGVKKKTENGTVTEVKIEEIEVEEDGIPDFPTSAGDGWEWIEESEIWSERPINIETEGQSPIFYDKFYAKVYYSGTTKPDIFNLPDGMIRVIGRYLGKTTDNKLKLFTTVYDNSFSDTLEIQVIRPNKLGDTDKIITGPTKQEGVFEDYNIDSLIIDIAGEIGILPQIIKGIMKKESIRFKPSYRYEIFQDIGGTIRNSFDSTHTYWIKSETEPGYPGIPNHGTIWYGLQTSKDGYPEPTSAWEFLMNNFYLYYTDMVFVLNPTDSLTSAIYKSEKNKIMELYNNFYAGLKKNGKTDQQAEDTAKVKTQQGYLLYLKDEYGEIGMDSIYAQTRIIASYGLMQLTYYGAVDSYRDDWNLEYPDNDINYLPEDINIVPINIEYGTKHLLGKLRNALGPIKYLKSDTWNKDYGFELSYWNGLRNYNNSSKYPNPVFNYTKIYLPKK